LTVASIANVPYGVYQVFYQIKHIINTSPIAFTQQRIGVCDTINSINTLINNMESLENQVITRPTGNFSIMGGGVWIENSSTPDTAFLNISYTFGVGPALTADGIIRIVRIG
jgi:hypothetical protein